MVNGETIIIGITIVLLFLILIIFRDKLMVLPIKLDISKIGIKLDTNTFALVIVAMLAILYLEINSMIKNDKEKIGSLQGQVNSLKTQMANDNQNFYNKFQRYKYAFEIQIPTEKNLSVLKKDIQLIVWKNKKDPARIPADKYYITSDNRIGLDLDDLMADDKIQLEVTIKDVGHFSSDLFEIPKYSIAMKN